MHQKRKLLKQINKLIKRLREILIRPLNSAVIFGKSFAPPIISIHELETDVETDSDDSTMDEILNLPLRQLPIDSGINKEDHKLPSEDLKSLPFEVQDLQQTELTLEFVLHTFSKLMELDDTR